MRWETGRRSTNVEDLRGMGGTGMVVGGGLGSLILALIVTLLGGDPSSVLPGSNQADYSPAPSGASSPQEEQLVDFVRVVLGDTEDTWNQIFLNQFGHPYQDPKLALFSGTVDSGCGLGKTAMGPFYCPRDQKVYIDLSFYKDLRTQFQAPGDFAQAYVIAHEVGHHVQNLIGISDQVHQRQQRVSETEANQLSVRLELQADCLAGVWANHAQKARQILEQGDVEEALNAASQIGDDRLQMEARGYVTPDSFTHGSSEQRVRWFSRGIQSGDLEQCNTFDAANP